MFVNAIMFYKVKDPISAVSNVDDYTSSARLLSATTLRDGQIFLQYQTHHTAQAKSAFVINEKDFLKMSLSEY